MKLIKLLSFLVFSLIFQLLNAQNYFNGVVFTSDAQRIVGDIKIVNNNTVKIKHSANKKGQLLAADQIKTIELANHTIYASMVWGNKHLILEQLVEGKTELYRSVKKDKTKEHSFFWQLDNDLIKLSEKNYLGRISYHTNDCPHLVQMKDKDLAKKIPFRPQEIANILHQYNRCKNFPSKILYQERKGVNFGVVGGIHTNNISFESGLLKREQLNHKMGYHLGAILTANLKPAFSLNVELAINSEGINSTEITPFKITRPEQFYTFDFNTTRVQATFLMEKKFGSLSKKHPFVELGLLFGNAIKNKINYDFPDEIQEPTREQLIVNIESDNYGFVIGGGVIFPMKKERHYFIKLRYSRKRFNTVTSLNAMTTQIGLLTGFRF